MSMSGRRILKTTAVVLGAGALGALGSGTAFAATPTDLGVAPSSHGTSATDGAGLSAPSLSKGGELHTFSPPKMSTHVADPAAGYDDSNYSNDLGSAGGDSNPYDSTGNYGGSTNYGGTSSYGGTSGYGYGNSDYGNGYSDNGYSDNGYSDNGYRRDNDKGLLGGGLLGGNN